jgi:LAO/AO transport system kinase
MVPAEDPIDADEALARAVLGPPDAAQRRALAKCITLLESTRADHRRRADALLNRLLPHTGRALRIGLSGVPGVGKSTFIESLGVMLIGQGLRVAVLTVDPTSQLSGGSILGDKTRMERLSVDTRAFIRPSPAGATLGGVAEKTREAMLVCEAAGFDVVIIETVGVGQSETTVAGMCDCFVLLQLPNAGDELQAIKRGVMELADLVVINKADLDPDAAMRARAQITSSLRIVTQHGHPDHAAAAARWQPVVLQVSALAGDGLAEVWSVVERHAEHQRRHGEREARRREQNQAWMWERIEAGLLQRFHAAAAVRAELPTLAAAVQAGQMPASVAARRALDLFSPAPA